MSWAQPLTVLMSSQISGPAPNVQSWRRTAVLSSEVTPCDGKGMLAASQNQIPKDSTVREAA